MKMHWAQKPSEIGGLQPNITPQTILHGNLNKFRREVIHVTKIQKKTFALARENDISTV